MPGTPSLRAWWARRPPAAGAAVMATGIVSTGLRLTGHEPLSRIALALACVGWLVLAADFVVRLLREREGWLAEARTPVALTAVAATAVLGTCFATLGRPVLAEALLALAAVLWPVLHVLGMRHCRRRMPGAVFLCCVAAQGTAVLAATLAGTEATAWLAHAALVLFWLGLVLYGVALAHFDLRQVVEGAGDHWIAGGALAISALAAAKLLSADSARLYLWNDDDRGVLREVSLTLIVLDLSWYVVLLSAELARPRLGYDERRWATVFPMGMSSVALLSVSAAVGISWLRWPGRVLLWLAVAVWLAVAAGAVASARAGIRAAR
ncbi:tellurite resistance/C4-dicarboxylate transporter family protein [Streptomyces olivochromogenes]|uniref:tellurite resistance/C4-dicarboxylate transporter family protein n=1 Tax=Streptomyces olivochromogenes TaxID=1963 RepID=UPI001F46CB4A|nr:tellurite resistance/C4-dicarboxylate transporter family protein [Streptomyces olivochromogenes]MCF3133873.1 tellurite resistance/C4-dicarboxylate transporter family protein [Streptomyces olivochromogenes]